MRNSRRDIAEFVSGGIFAAILFFTLTLLEGVLASSPSSDYAKGIAVISAKISGFGGLNGREAQKSPPGENAEITDAGGPPSAPKAGLDARAAQELIRLGGFGGWDIEAAPQEIQESGGNAEEPKDEEGLPYPDDIDGRDGRIVRKTYTYRTSTTYLELPGGGLLRNCTDIDSGYLLEQCAREPDFGFDPSAGPLVLIMHTHTTESYEPRERDYYDADFSSRTTDLEKSVAAVGEAIAEGLEDAGIGVIHDKTVHDYPRYTGAYDRSAETVKEYLEKYPSIKIVIDVHRDAIEEDGVRYAPAAEINGQSAAQVMIICGCTNVPQYRYNLRTAARLQSQMETDWPGLTRPILFDERNYNQELTHGSFLIEMGSNANSLGEAVYSGELVGKSLARVILGLRGY